MINFLTNLKFRNEALFYFGSVCFIGAVLMLFTSVRFPLVVKGANAWYKPIKFAISIGILCWSMAWYTYELGLPGQVKPYSLAMIIFLGYDLLYISVQAARRQTSHFNNSTPIYSTLTAVLAIAAFGATIYTTYIGLLFWTNDLSLLPVYYLWSIRLGIALFVIFALEGGLMGAITSHTIGGPDGEKGLPFLNWSRQYGDPRIAHFIDMHALQVIPLLACYILKNTKLVFDLSIFYFGIVLLILIQALNAKPLIK